jgi:hypothetical protein
MNASYLLDSGKPNVPELSNMFQRCGPVVAGGLAWLDNTRFCRWPNQFVDGRKHDIPGKKDGAAIPFDGASDMRPFVVDDIIAERAAMKATAFWHARMQPGSSETDDGNYAIALLEWLIFRLMFYDLTREVELSAQYEEHYGWMVLAPRWRREIGMKKKTITLAEIQQAAQEVQQQQSQQQQAQDQGQDPGPAIDPQLVQLAQLPTMIADPMQEDAAIEFLSQWYDRYVKNEVPADMQDAVPDVKISTVRKAVQDLRDTGTGTVPIAYLAKNQPEIAALKPWDEVFIPPELTTENEIVFQVERVHEGELRSRIITDGYDKDWVEKAVKYKGAITAAPMEIRATPLGLGGLTGGATSSPVFSAQPTLNNTLIEILHCIYRAADADGVPAIYNTTIHKLITESCAKHEEVEGCGADLPYAAGVREWWCRSITSSRGVPERAHTTQNIIKGILDSIIDRANITALPPVNVYESPTGAQYKFGPAVQNYVRMGKEPKFMETPNGQGLSESVEVLTAVTKMKDNSYGLMSEDVPAPRLQMSQSMAVARFLMTWNKAMQQVMALCRVHMEDADFGDITGAPAGWLDAHRDDADVLNVSLMFDVRELDSELMMKRIETMNNIALPADVMGTINRAQWSSDMVRAILGPMAAKRLVTPLPDASQALMDKANLEVLKMFAGNPPNFMDKADPTAAGLLQDVQQIVTQNPTYLRALTDDALATVAGQNAGQIVQQIGPRNPDPRFSELLTKYLQNLKFIGVTQPENQQIGKMGVNPQTPGGIQTQMQIKQPLTPPQMINAQ